MEFSVHVMSVKRLNLQEASNTNTEAELYSEMHTT
jgi:hypothetical protein